MVKSKNLKDSKRDKVSKEISKFNKLIEGHRKILLAIGRL